MSLSGTVASSCMRKQICMLQEVAKGSIWQGSFGRRW